MTTARFDPAGGPLAAEIACAPRRDGSYSLTLWEAAVNQVVERWRGNFVNPADDRFELPPPAAAHAGRLLEALVVAAVPAGVGPSTVSLVVTQDGRELAREEADIPPGSPGGMADLFVELVAR